jgi:2-polyprenyl-3-methyl-5-hydroxy-6-metoxy-1,4-benzoquinol methylase
MRRRAQVDRLRVVARVAGLLLMLGLPHPAAAQLASRPADEWIRTLETPSRLESLKIYETLAALKLKPGQIVADIGAGTGVFTIPLAQATKPGGTVYAEDIDQALLDVISEKATEQGMTNVQAVLGEFGDPDLPADIDLAFINDVLHHIKDRAAYLKTLAAYLKPGGRIAIIELIPGQGGHKGEPELQVSQEEATKWMADAGLKPVDQIKLFTDRWFVIYGKQ